MKKNRLRNLWYRFAGWSWSVEGYLRVSTYWNQLRWFWQRGRRGWSERDVWALDEYLAKIIADTVDHLRTSAHTFVPLCPTTRRRITMFGTTCSECQMVHTQAELVLVWQQELSDIVSAFREYEEGNVSAHGDPWKEWWNGLLPRLSKVLYHLPFLWD